MRVLGIDPGSRATGYGVVSFSDRRVQYVASGLIRSKDKDFFSRLGEIHSGVQQVISELNPVVMAVEDVFVSRNASSALKLGQARGVVVAAASSAKLPIFSYAPRLIKKNLAGTGSASKEQVAFMVKALLNLPDVPSSDAADALAIALCHVDTHLNKA